MRKEITVDNTHGLTAAALTVTLYNLECADDTLSICVSLIPKVSL